MPIPRIAASIDARVLSSLKAEREAASAKLEGPEVKTSAGDTKALIEKVHDALYAAKIAAYAQGMDLIHEASNEFNWNVNLKETARIWKGGCIIRARFLDTIMKAYEKNPELPNLLLDDTLREAARLASKRGATWCAWPSSRAFRYQAWRRVWPTSTAIARPTCPRTSPRHSATPSARTRTSAKTTRRVRSCTPTGWVTSDDGNETRP